MNGTRSHGSLSFIFRYVTLLTDPQFKAIPSRQRTWQIKASCHCVIIKGHCVILTEFCYVFAYFLNCNSHKKKQTRVLPLKKTTKHVFEGVKLLVTGFIVTYNGHHTLTSRKVKIDGHFRIIVYVLQRLPLQHTSITLFELISYTYIAITIEVVGKRST